VTGTPEWTVEENSLITEDGAGPLKKIRVWRVRGPSTPITLPSCKMLFTAEREARVAAAAPTNEAIVAMFYGAILNGQSVAHIMDLARQSLVKTRKELPGIDQASERSKFMRRAIDIAKAFPDMTPVQAALEAERQIKQEKIEQEKWEAERLRDAENLASARKKLISQSDDEGPEVNS
jgi:hypothetical protein